MKIPKILLAMALAVGAPVNASAASSGPLAISCSVISKSLSSFKSEYSTKITRSEKIFIIDEESKIVQEYTDGKTQIPCVSECRFIFEHDSISWKSKIITDGASIEKYSVIDRLVGKYYDKDIMRMDGYNPSITESRGECVRISLNRRKF